MPTKIQDMTSWGPLGGPSTRPSSLLDPVSGPASVGGRSIHDSSLDRSTQSRVDGSGEWQTATTDIGKRVDERRWELNVVCEAGDALRVQFEALSLPFIALHDIGGNTSRRFIAGVAAAMQTQVRSLQIRRQGYGDTLATIDYVDLPTIDERTRTAPILRVYSTTVRDATDAAAKHLADVLMGHSKLAVVMVATDAKLQQLAVSLAWMKDAMAREGWHNRNVLMMPLRPVEALAAQVARMGSGKKIDIRIAPPVVRPLDAWNYLRSTWNLVSRMGAEQGESRMMLLGDPTQANNSVAVARRAARIAERVATGRATAEELRLHLEGPLADGVAESETTVDVPPVIETVRSAANSFHASDLRPLKMETVPRAPAWSATRAAGLDAPMEAATPALTPSKPQPVHVTSSDGGLASEAPRVPSIAAPTTPVPRAGSDQRIDSAAGMGAASSTPPIANTPSRPAAVPNAAGQALAADAWPSLSAPAPSTPTPLAPAVRPVVASKDGGAPKPSPEAVQTFMAHCAQIKGLQQCAIVDIASRAVVASHGVAQDASFASDATRLSNALRAAAIAMGFAGKLPEATLCYDDHHVVLRPLPHDERLAVVAVLHKDEANAVVVQLKLQRLAATAWPTAALQKATVAG